MALLLLKRTSAFGAQVKFSDNASRGFLNFVLRIWLRTVIYLALPISKLKRSYCPHEHLITLRWQNMFCFLACKLGIQALSIANAGPATILGYFL